MVCAFLELLCFGGLIFGVPSYMYILKEDAVYSHLCEINHNSSHDEAIAVMNISDNKLQATPVPSIQATQNSSQNEDYTEMNTSNHIIQSTYSTTYIQENFNVSLTGESDEMNISSNTLQTTLHITNTLRTKSNVLSTIQSAELSSGYEVKYSSEATLGITYPQKNPVYYTSDGISSPTIQSPSDISSHRGCVTSYNMLSLAFTLVVSTMGPVGLPMGFFFDYFGLRKSRIIAL